MKDLSIIVPVYNVGAYLEECLLSILSVKSSLDFELVLIDDGSSDNSLSICKKYESSNVIVVSNTNHGVSYSRNCGLQYASGKYVMFVDADDKLLQNWDIHILDALRADTDIVYFSDKYSNVCYTREDVINSLVGVGSRREMPFISSPCSKLYKVHALKENDIRFIEDVINGEDLIFNLDCILKMHTFSVYSKSIYLYRQVITSATHTFNAKFYQSNILFLESLNSRLIENDYSVDDCIRIVSHSFVNSVYLLLHRISQIPDGKARKERMNLFKTDEFSKLVYKYSDLSNESFSRKIIYKLIKTQHFVIALSMMLIRNLFVESKMKKNKEIWQKI